jgi:hypothetical protein
MHIPILEAKISQLESFESRIPGFESQLENRPAPMP